MRKPKYTILVNGRMFRVYGELNAQQPGDPPLLLRHVKMSKHKEPRKIYSLMFPGNICIKVYVEEKNSKVTGGMKYLICTPIDSKQPDVPEWIHSPKKWNETHEAISKEEFLKALETGECDKCPEGWNVGLS